MTTTITPLHSALKNSGTLDDESLTTGRNVRAGRVRTPPPKKKDASAPVSTDQPRQQENSATVSDEEMSATLGKINGQLSAASGTSVGLTQDLSNVSIQEMIAMVTNVVVSVSNKSAALSLDRMRGNSDAYQANFQQQNKDTQNKLDEMAKAQRNAKKAATATTVMNWAISSLEIVSGIVKIGMGIFPPNPMLIGGGATELVAGVMGTVKNICVASGTKAGLEASKVFNGVQIGFEVLSTAIDVFSVAMVVRAGLTVAKVGAEAVVTGAEIAAKAAESGVEAGAEIGVEAGAEIGVEAGAEIGVEAGAEIGAEAGAEIGAEAGAERGAEAGAERGAEAGAEAGAEVGANAARTAARKLTEEGIKEAGKKISEETMQACTKEFKQLTAKLGEKTVSKIIGESAGEVVKTMVKDGKELVPEEVAKALAKQLAKRFAKAAIGTLAKSPAAALKGIAAGATKLQSGVLAYQTAGVERKVSEKESIMDLRQAFIDTLASDSDNAASMASDALKKQASAMEDALRLSNQNPQYQFNS